MPTDAPPDNRIIHLHGRHAVLARRHEVMWRDGSTVWLHAAQLDGRDAPLLRALQVDGLWAVLDLARALPATADDLRTQPRRDGQGLIFFALRAHWASAAAFVCHMRPHLQPLQALGPMKAAA